MLFYGLASIDITNIRIVNYEDSYRIPDLIEFFNDIKEIEVCYTARTSKYNHIKGMILPSYISDVTWYYTQWLSDWLYSMPKGVNNQDVAFETNINRIQELLDRGLIRIKRDKVKVLVKKPFEFTKYHLVCKEGTTILPYTVLQELTQVKKQFGRNINDYIKII